jgi:hypothetical protein
MITPSELAYSAASEAQPPPHLSSALQALWLAKAGRWDDSHDACQNLPGVAGSWIHAHLHRQEGDYDNAAYWYRRAHQPVPPRSLSIEAEWNQLVEALR